MCALHCTAAGLPFVPRLKGVAKVIFQKEKKTLVFSFLLYGYLLCSRVRVCDCDLQAFPSNQVGSSLITIPRTKDLTDSIILTAGTERLDSRVGE